MLSCFGFQTAGLKLHISKTAQRDLSYYSVFPHYLLVLENPGPHHSGLQPIPAFPQYLLFKCLTELILIWYFGGEGEMAIFMMKREPRASCEGRVLSRASRGMETSERM
jgi:hypothetical protein